MIVKRAYSLQFIDIIFIFISYSIYRLRMVLYSTVGQPFFFFFFFFDSGVFIIKLSCLVCQFSSVS